MAPNPFEHLVNQVVELPNKKSITAGQYNTWKQTWVFDALKGYRLGQSFCEYFGILGSPLYYFRDNNLCERWILDNYMEDEKEIH